MLVQLLSSNEGNSILGFSEFRLRYATASDLVACSCRTAVENNVMPIKTAEEVENEISQEYQNRLKLNDIEIPDPFKLEENWLAEEEGLIHWPTVLYPDIYNYLMFDPAELASTDLNDYR